MEEREARFLMRQRGAGTRNVDDFSFTVGAGSDSISVSDDGLRSNATLEDSLVEKPGPVNRSDTRPERRANDNAAREQRFEMRRRGPGTREQNVDFTLNLNVPATSSPTSRTSDAGSTSSTGASLGRRTGAQRQGFVAAPSPLRLNARQSVAKTAGINGDDSAPQNGQPSLQVEEEAADTEAGDADFFEDGGIQDPSEEDMPAETATVSTGSPQASSNGSVRKRKKKKSVLRKPKKRKTANSVSSVASSTIAEEDETSRIEEPVQTSKQALAETGHSQQSGIPRSQLRNDEIPPEESVVQLDAGSTNDNRITASSEQPKLFSIFNRPDRPPLMPSNPAVQRILSQHGMSNKENRPLQVRSKPVAATAGSSAKSNSKKTTRKRGERQAKQKSTTTHGLAENNNEVAITVRRVVNISHLEFLSANDDDLQTEQIPALRQKRAPNGIDVLAQICREIIDKRIKAIATNQDTTSSNSSIKRQTDTIRRFSDELDSRLLLMTTALDHNISLTHSLKEASRQKASHRSTLLELRQRRHEIELQQDSIRAANEAQTTLSSERFELNSLLADIQLAVQRGKEDSNSSSAHDIYSELPRERESISSRIQRVSEVVSSANGRQGILQRVQAVNTLLERLLTPMAQESV